MIPKSLNSTKIFLWFLFFLIAFEPAFALSNYSRVILYSTGAKEGGLDLPLSTAYGGPFYVDPRHIEGHYIQARTFAFDNNANIIMADFSANKSIVVFNTIDSSFEIIKPTTNDFGLMQIVRIGPQEEIYAELTTLFEKPKRYKLVKYVKAQGKYIKDDGFYSVEFTESFQRLTLSPDGYLYSVKGTDFGYGRTNQFNIFDSEGQLTKQAISICKTSNGTEFYIENDKTEAGNRRLKIIDTNSNTVMAQYEGVKTTGFSFLQPIFDNKIVFKASDSETEKTFLDNDFYLITTRPYFIVVDLGSGLTTEIPTSECARDDYLYFNVSRVGCNYKGELFAAVVYFNTPGEITGDEKIVFYRWRLE